MKLSEAIVLGDTLKKCDPFCFISNDGSYGCAFGGALLAAGVTAEQYTNEFQLSTGPVAEMECAKKLWPWLTRDQLAEIGSLYHSVVEGRITIQDIAAYVCTIEPDEDLAEQCRLEDIEAERESSDLGGYCDPAENPRLA